MEQKKVITKRYSLNADERLKVENIESVMGILAIIRQGLDASLTLALTGPRIRLKLSQDNAPKDHTRNVSYDRDKAQLVVDDVPNPPEPDKTEETPMTEEEAAKLN